VGFLDAFRDRLAGGFRRRSAQDLLAAEVRAALRAVGIESARYDRAAFAIRVGFPDGLAARIYLGTLYAECVRDPASRAERIRRFVATFTERAGVPTTWAEAKPLLRPVLRRCMFARDGPGGTGTRPLRRPALPFLDEMVVVDQPTSMAYVNDANRSGWGVAAEEVFAAARANLSGWTPRTADLVLDGPVMLHFIDDGDAYWVSRLLVDGWLAGLAEQVGGRPVAFAPDVATLLVVADEPDRLASVFEQVREEFVEAPRALSPMGYTVDGAGRVVPYMAPSGHPLAGPVDRAERVLAAYEYAAQQVQLRGGNTAEDVATFDVYATPHGGTFTVATWVRGTTALLPRTDFVGFAEPGGTPFYVPWSAVSEADVLSETLEHRPVRYRASDWPGPTALGYLRERAVPLRV
jgi:hypothetical protein